MRRGKRFSPNLIRKWMEAGRGTGQKEHYQGWHRVTRADPGSRGASAWLLSNDGKRLADVLSLGEELVHALAQFCPGFIDAQENFPLSREHHAGESARLLGTEPGSYLGTLEIAKGLGLKHPEIRKNGDKESWIMSSDNLVTTSLDGHFEMIAVSVKNSEELSRRERELALIEKTYWNQQGVQWLLITPALYAPGVREACRCYLPFAISSPLHASELLNRVASLVLGIQYPTLTKSLRSIEQVIGCSGHTAQGLFWQSVFTGRIPLDLPDALWPGQTLKFLDPSSFWSQNPVASRRSSWKY